MGAKFHRVASERRGDQEDATKIIQRAGEVETEYSKVWQKMVAFSREEHRSKTWLKYSVTKEILDKKLIRVVISDLQFSEGTVCIRLCNEVGVGEYYKNTQNEVQNLLE